LKLPYEEWVWQLGEGEAYGSATKFKDARLKTKSRRPLQNQLQ
jgi:hypothetical protein